MALADNVIWLTRSTKVMLTSLLSMPAPVFDPTVTTPCTGDVTVVVAKPPIVIDESLLKVEIPLTFTK